MAGRRMGWRGGGVLLAIGLTASGLVGCGSRAELATVRGKVTLDGTPLANAFVVFTPTTQGTTSYGKTDANGEYEMMFTDREAGAWVGENLVRINTGDVGAGGGAGAAERVPEVYNRVTTLKVDVRQQANTFDFALDSRAGKILAAPKE